MAFPNTPLDKRAELYLGPGLGWVDATGDTLARAPYTITRGRQPSAQRVDPGSLTLTLNNREGKYSPRNPRSPYYGLIGRNTPIRVSVPGTESYLALDGSDTGNAATQPRSFGLVGEIDVRIEMTTDWKVLGRGLTLIGQYDGADPGGWIVRMTADGQISLFVPTTGGSGGMQNFPRSNITERAAFRLVWIADDGTGTARNHIYSAPSLDGPWTLAGEFSKPSEGTMLDTSALPLRIAPFYVSSSGDPRSPAEGLVHRAELRTAMDGPIVAAPDFRDLAPGTTSFTDSAGVDWELNGTAEITDRAYRFHGEVSEWPPRWDVSGEDRYVPITASGVLRRMGQGAPALQSTLRRRIPGGGGQAVPRGYWPMEEGAYATQAYSPLPGVPPLRTKSLQWASDDSLFGSDALPTLGQSASIDARPDPTSPSLGGWTVDLSYRLEKLPSNARQFLSVRLAGAAAARVEVDVSTAGVEIAMYDAEGTRLNGFTATDPNALAAFVGAWNRLQVFSATSGGQTYAVASWRDVVTGISWMVGAPYTGGPGVLTRVAGTWGQDLSGMAIGHLSIWGVGGAVTSTSPLRFATGITYFDDADDGYEGETAWTRVNRLAFEEGVPVFTRTGDEVSARVGPQRVQTFLDLLEEAAVADGGLLYEHRRTPTLAFRSRSTLYNQTPKLVLDYASGREIAPPLEPTEDDEGVVNDVTVQRTGGSSGRAVLTEGPLSVQPPPDGIGLVTSSTTLNLADDGQTEPMAHWLLHLGTVDEARYPTVHVRLHAAPHLIDQVLALDVLDRMQILNPPPWLPPGLIDLLADGWTETLGVYTWDITFNCSPGGPWVLGELVDDYDVTEDFADEDLAVDLAGAGDLPWTRDDVQAHSGTWSLRSGAILDNQTSDAVLTLPPDARRVSFWYMTSSEMSGTGFEGDRLTVLVDGVQVLRAQGETAWTEHTLDVAGAAAVTFRYSKDNSASSGADAAWIDDLTIAVIGDAGTDRPNRVDTGGSQLAAAAGEEDTVLQVATPTGETWAEDPDDAPFDIRLGGEVARVTAVRPAVEDDFARTVAGGWGTSSSGTPWVTSGGTAAEFAVDGAAGAITPSATPSDLRFAEVVEVAGTIEQLAAISVDSIPAGGEYLPGLFARAGTVDAATAFYWLHLVLTPSGTALLELRHTVTPEGPRVGPLFAWAPGDRMWLRMRVDGRRVRGRAWPSHEPEPSAWHIDRTMPNLPDGTYGFTVASTDGTATAPTYSVDDYRADTRIQRFTVQRAVNGIAKDHATGTDVRLAQPAIVAL